ncbi:MAG: hypothetical protein JWM05_2636 [Acidimicrobiales bacterium]|nr:hypothetical protein [Acidimicrobiales bacterium]
MRTCLLRSAVLAAILASAALAGCATDAPTAAVTLRQGRVVVRYKPCRASERLAGLDLYGADAPDRPVWSARLRPHARPLLEVTVGASVPGYRVTDRLGARGPQPGVRYSFDARSTDGRAWGGPDVRPEKLRAGRVLVAGRDLAYADWASRPATCPRVTPVSAVLAGLAVAAVGGALMLAVRGPLRALSRRRGTPLVRTDG